MTTSAFAGNSSTQIEIDTSVMTVASTLVNLSATSTVDATAALDVSGASADTVTCELAINGKRISTPVEVEPVQALTLAGSTLYPGKTLERSGAYDVELLCVRVGSEPAYAHDLNLLAWATG